MSSKLVRDKHTAGPGERVVPANTRAGKHLAITQKLHEEVCELADDPTDLGEYADVLELLQEIARQNGVDWRDVEARQLQKRDERGGFRKCLVRMRGSSLREPPDWPPADLRTMTDPTNDRSSA